MVDDGTDAKLYQSCRSLGLHRCRGEGSPATWARTGLTALIAQACILKTALHCADPWSLDRRMPITPPPHIYIYIHTYTHTHIHTPVAKLCKGRAKNYLSLYMPSGRKIHAKKQVGLMFLRWVTYLQRLPENTWASRCLEMTIKVHCVTISAESCRVTFLMQWCRKCSSYLPTSHSLVLQKKIPCHAL